MGLKKQERKKGKIIYLQCGEHANESNRNQGLQPEKDVPYDALFTGNGSFQCNSYNKKLHSAAQFVETTGFKYTLSHCIPFRSPAKTN